MTERKSVSSRVRGGASRAGHAGKAAFDRLRTATRTRKPPAASSEQKPAAAATAEKENESASAEQ
jgi:hypothetical protein